VEDQFGRFSWGIPPEKNGDYAFLLHILKSLKSIGKGAVILPHGVLFRGNAEARIRENLVKQGYIKGIIGLPANLFYGTSIPACIIVLDKEQAKQRTGIFMIDASKGFKKDGNKNRLRDQDIHKVVDVFTKQLQLPRYSRMVALTEIAGNDYNLNISRYIDASEPEDLHDLSAHLQGGIPMADIDALERFWQVFPSLRVTLFKPSRPGYCNALVKANLVKRTILAHPEFNTFAERSLVPFLEWQDSSNLRNIHPGDKPKAVIHGISEDLLERYSAIPLLSKYDIYQILMDYWSETMQDDVYVLVQDDWAAGRQLRELVVKRGEKLKEAPDITIGKSKYKAELIPPALIGARFFPQYVARISQLQAAYDSACQALESFLEEHCGDDGLLSDALNDKDKVTKASVTARQKLTMDAEETAALKQVKKLFDAEATAKNALRDAEDELDLAVFRQYPLLSLEDIQNLLVTDKWLASLQAGIEAEIERVIQQLTNRVRELEQRYARALSELNAEVELLSLRAAGHLRAMGLEA